MVVVVSSQIKIKSMCDGWCVWPSLIRFLSGSSHSSEQLEEVSISLVRVGLYIRFHALCLCSFCKSNMMTFRSQFRCPQITSLFTEENRELNSVKSSVFSKNCCSVFYSVLSSSWSSFGSLPGPRAKK